LGLDPLFDPATGICSSNNYIATPSRLINHVEDKAKISRLSPVEIKTILVPTDLRPESMIALRYALTLAKQFDANLTLLHVLEEPYTSDTELEPGAEELPVLKKSNEERELALLEEELRSEYRNCRSCFRVGSPFRQIVHEAENIKASVIVISSHSYGWLERILHGSGADVILHSTLCPVLVVKEPGTAQGSEPQETPEPR
jgi:nucleotide-binding universal stress UspA family protein